MKITPVPRFEVDERTGGGPGVVVVSFVTRSHGQVAASSRSGTDQLVSRAAM